MEDKRIKQFAFYIEKILTEENSNKASYFDKCKEIYKLLKRIRDKSKFIDIKYAKLDFFDIFISACITYINKNNDIENNVLMNLFESSINKYSSIVSLLNAKQYESAMIINRSFYESLVIIRYLQKNYSKGYISSFRTCSAIRFFKALNIKNSDYKIIFENLMKQDENKLIMKKKSEYNINGLKYGWSGINTGEEITFEDILKSTYEDQKYEQALITFKVMYRFSSEIIHSNSIHILEHARIMENMTGILVENFELSTMLEILCGFFESKSLYEKEIIEIIIGIAQEDYKKIYKIPENPTSSNKR
jgi:hypothetical protein